MKTTTNTERQERPDPGRVVLRGEGRIMRGLLRRYRARRAPGTAGWRPPIRLRAYLSNTTRNCIAFCASGRREAASSA